MRATRGSLPAREPIGCAVRAVRPRRANASFCAMNEEGPPLIVRVACHVREARAAQGLAASRVALAAGIDPGHLRRVEAGTIDLRLSTLERLARALRVEVAALVAGPVKVAEGAPPRAHALALGATLRRCRVARGWTHAELAARAHVSPQYLQRVERDRQSPTVRVLVRIADALGVPAARLVGGEG